MTPEKAIGTAVMLIGGLIFASKTILKKRQQVADNSQETETETETTENNKDLTVDNADLPA